MNFLKKLFNKIQDNTQTPETSYIVASLNDKIMPIDRCEVYEDPLDTLLSSKSLNGITGEVTGGGTLQEETGEITLCDLEIEIHTASPTREQTRSIIQALESMGAPKGSKLIIESRNEEIPFGKKEGLALYLDGVNLPDEIYENQDTDALIANLLNALSLPEDYILRYWNGPTETGLYFYGDHFEHMKRAIEPVISSQPECQNCCIEQIA